MNNQPELNQHNTFILHIINEILTEANSSSHEEFERNEQLKERIYSQLQEVGQASYEILNIPDVELENRNIYENLANFRNARYNQETELDHNMIWSVITNDLPEIEIMLERSIEPVENS
ncbi:MAG: hypothetical protein CMO01_13335 [Thalassobius sp.]|nr:hypothetical protein [Thalassovita sp.]